MTIDLVALALMLIFVWVMAGSVPPPKRPALLTSLAGVIVAIATVLTNLH
jgi:hypothetical protein